MVAASRDRLHLRSRVAGAAASIIVAAASMALAAPAQQSPPPDKPAAPHAPVATLPDVQQDRAALAGLWQGGRYRLTPGDVVELAFPYVPEFNQTVTVQPDGFIALRGVPDITAAGRTVPELKTDVIDAYASIIRDPAVTLVLKEFEKPYFVIGGEVTRPGKYDLRGAMTVSQAIAVAGGKTSSANISDVVLFRRFGNDLVDVKRVDVKRMYSRRDLSGDPIIRPGDTLFIPKSTFSKIAGFIPKPTAGFFLNPFSW